MVNLKTINKIYLDHYALPDTLGNDTIARLSDDDLKLLSGIVSQCALRGGPAVYQAQNLYWRNIDSLEFVDEVYCDTEMEERMSRRHNLNQDSTQELASYAFRLFPTLIPVNGTFQTESTDPGKIYFYNSMGQLLYKTVIQKGVTIYDCKVLGCPNEIILYKAVLENGRTENGKIVIVK